MRALLNRLRLLDQPRLRAPCVIAANAHGTYCLPRKALHRPACQAILRGRVWEADTIRFLVDEANGDIVHAGTFFGDFLPALSRAYERVWAFEPNPDSFKCAGITVRLNDLPNVSLRNSGLGRAAGLASMTTERDGVCLGGGSFIVEQPGGIRMEAIDAIVPADRHVGVIHLDVEGYEGAALEGARETIRRCRPILVLETLPGAIEGYCETRTLDANHVLRPVESDTDLR